jgi:portal protein
MASVFSRLSRVVRHAWNAFTNDEQTNTSSFIGGSVSYGNRPDRTRLRFSTERSILASILTRVSIDVASVDIRHVRLDDNKRYLEDIESGLNNCLTLEANVDQGARHFRQDMALTLFDKGTIAIVPVDTTINPATSGGFDIKTLRVGEIVEWMPLKIRARVYNERKGFQEDIVLDKSFVGIVENPLYSVMNEPSSTLQRLIRKLNLLDAVDEQSSSGKLDMIIQLPYIIKSEARRKQAEDRRKDIEAQLRGSQYGIAYTDGTEKVIQLNRPAENNLLKQVEFLINLLYTQLGVTPEVMNGTADEKTMINYFNRTIEPVVQAIVESMRRTFLTKTARSQKQWILYFRNPFNFVPITDIAEIADKFVRNTIATPNDIRVSIGWVPSKDPGSDKLLNPNMPAPSVPGNSQPIPSEGGTSQNGA